eukprot:14577641-Ditylum_brightwellii.AAC.1
MVPYAAARNPYTSSCVTYMSQQKVSYYPNIVSTRNYVPMHRWSMGPPAQDTNSVHNLTDGIDFNK